MDPHHDPLSSWKSPTWPSPASIKPSSTSFSTRSDRERDAPEYARALSSEVIPYASSIISSSDSNSHYRSSRGSVASSLLCPLLDFHDSSRRHSDAGSILPMRPLPAINPSPDILPFRINRHSDSGYQILASPSWPKEPGGGPGASAGGGGVLCSANMSNSVSACGGNLFIPLRRRFLPDMDRASLLLKPRVETQLLGELLLALEEYVAAFGRQVKVSRSHQFSLGGASAAAVVVAAAGGPSGSHHLRINDLEALTNQHQAQEPTDHQAAQEDPTLTKLELDHDFLGLEVSDRSRLVEKTDETPEANINPTPQSRSKVDRTLLSELCEELEYVTREVIDVVPAFGEKLIQGHYGPLAVRGHSTSVPSNSPCSDPTNHGSIHSCQPAHNRQSKFSSALERFADYEPGGSQDTSDGGSGWWAERLLRDLLEGIVAETVVKSVSTTSLLSTNSNLMSLEPSPSNLMSRQASNTSSHLSSCDKASTSDRKSITTSFGYKPKSWLGIPQSSSSSSSSSSNSAIPNSLFTAKSSNLNLGISLSDEIEESPSIPPSKRKLDRTTKSNPNDHSKLNNDLLMTNNRQSNTTRGLLAEASQDSIFESHLSSYPRDKSKSNHSVSSLHDRPHSLQNVFHDEPKQFKSTERHLLSSYHHQLGSSDEKLKKAEHPNDDHQQKLLDEGRKRWLAFKANRQDQLHHHPMVSTNVTEHRSKIHQSSSILSYNHTNPFDNYTYSDHHPSSLDLNGNSRNRGSHPNPSSHHFNHRQLYHYLASHHRS